MHPISTIENPLPNIQILRVYSPFAQDGEIIFPIELDNDIFIMRWNHGWLCHGIANVEIISAIGDLLEKKFPDTFYADGN